MRIAVGGATGWTGAPLCRAIHDAADLTLIAGTARAAVGRDLGEVIGDGNWGVPVHADPADAFAAADVYVDFTTHATVKANILSAVTAGKHAIVGASGLTAADFDDIGAAAEVAGVAVIAAGNFAVLAALAQMAALRVATHVPTWEVIDYASYTKPDVPSGTARELAEKLSAVHRPGVGVDVDRIAGPREARGADVDGTRVHSIRQPGFVVSTEVVFGQPGQRLTIRFDAGDSPQPYVDGVLMAIRALPGRVGLTRGLDSLLDG